MKVVPPALMREFCIKLPDEPGQLATLCEELAARDVNINTAAAMTATGAVLAIVTEKLEETREVLDKLGHEYHESDVLTVVLPHKAGALAAMSRTMGNAGINIQSIYIMSKEEDDAVIAFTVDNPAAAREMI